MAGVKKKKKGMRVGGVNYTGNQDGAGGRRTVDYNVSLPSFPQIEEFMPKTREWVKKKRKSAKQKRAVASMRARGRRMR